MSYHVKTLKKQIYQNKMLYLKIIFHIISTIFKWNEIAIKQYIFDGFAKYSAKLKTV